MKNFLPCCLSLFFAMALIGCEKQEPIENPIPETFTLSVTGYSLAGELDLLFDGEVISSGSRVDMRPQTLLASKGERKIQVRYKGRTEILKTWTFDENSSDQSITFYWNGEKFTDQLEFPAIAQGNIGFMLDIPNKDNQNVVFVGPMDIEVFYLHTTPPVFDMEAGEPLDIIEGYLPGSGYTRFVEIPAPRPSVNRFNAEYLTFRLYKAGTKEPYTTIYYSRYGFYHTDYPDECYMYDGFSALSMTESTTFITTFTENDYYEVNDDHPGKTGEVGINISRIPDIRLSR